MALAKRVQGLARLERALEKSVQRVETREEAAALVTQMRMTEAKLVKPARNLYTPEDEPGMRRHGRVLVFLDPLAEAVPVPTVAMPLVRGSRKLVMWARDERRRMMDVGADGSPTLDLSAGAAVHVYREVADEDCTPYMMDDELMAATVRATAAAAIPYGDPRGDLWAVYGVYQGRRTEMLVWGRLSSLRRLWPDHMARRDLKRAGLSLHQVGSAFQIRRHGV